MINYVGYILKATSLKCHLTDDGELIRKQWHVEQHIALLR